ncbi:M14 family zinc carboxypeptidase [Spirosoma montaniterrae]|uniref:Peptidase M14 n=1 Tax=Spirosoma montaniterrae TaxID=1178516 RepID=A0A1P9X1L0_9BACT|nr:M14 family zinc carboxypeptidase [Spirosoma montaniterrae]AQG81526.1 peptidase M14 [Spirosoma montaniterrae]
MTQAQDMARRLHDAHDTFKEKTFTHRRFKHRDIVPLLNALNGQGPLTVAQAGESLEKRAIYKVQAGTGSTPILLWSQMHGDEATATMALFDLFNFLKASGDEFDALRQRILTTTTLHVVPMLNPDGAERFQRRTATDIDMNRDALRLQTPEGNLLKTLQQTLKPLVGFNLHDQNPRYSVGKTGKQAVLSFLATAYDEDRNVNDVRQRSMQLIVGMNRVLQQFVPGQVARYDDEFEPRAFGDNIQKWGTTLILIESGGYKYDTEKMTIRRLNFVAILTALASIAEETYKQERVEDYAAIPENGRALFDLLIRNATIVREGRNITVDIGINRYEEKADSVAQKKGRMFWYRSKIEDIGDLSTFGGLDEIDATGLTLTSARVYADTLDSVNDLRGLVPSKLAEQGITAFKVRQLKKDYFSEAPVHVLYEGKLPARPLEIGQIPTFLLKRGNRIQYNFVNGFPVGGQINPTMTVNGVSE